MSNEVKDFLRSVCVKGGCKQIAKRNKMFELGYRYAKDAWSGHDCVITKGGHVVCWRDGRKVTFV